MKVAHPKQTWLLSCIPERCRFWVSVFFCRAACWGSFGLVWMGMLLSQGCTGGALYTRQQLHGADPAWDLAAMDIMHRFKQKAPHTWSVKGVRLGDDLQRAEQLWGKASRTEAQHGVPYTIWTNASGQILLRVLLSQNQPERTHTIQQIDIFTGYLPHLHPRNRVLLASDQIESLSWRKKIFGAEGKIEQGSLDTRYVYPHYGIRLLVFSRLLPLQHSGSVVLTLYRVPTEASPAPISFRGTRTP